MIYYLETYFLYIWRYIYIFIYRTYSSINIYIRRLYFIKIFWMMIVIMFGILFLYMFKTATFLFDVFPPCTPLSYEISCVYFSCIIVDVLQINDVVGHKNVSYCYDCQQRIYGLLFFSSVYFYASNMIQESTLAKTVDRYISHFMQVGSQLWIVLQVCFFIGYVSAKQTACGTCVLIAFIPEKPLSRRPHINVYIGGLI